MVSFLLPAILQSSYFYPHFTDDERKCFSEHQNYLEDLNRFLDLPLSF